MGEGHSKLDEELDRQPNPIWAIDAKYCLDRPLTLKLISKVLSWSSDTYHIKEPETGQTWFEMKGKALSIRDKKILLDPNGTPLCNLRQMFGSVLEQNHKLYRGEDDTEEIMKFVCKPTLMKSKATVSFVNQANGEELQLTIKGGVATMSGTVFLGDPKDKENPGVPICKMDRKLKAKDLAGAPEYDITIAANVDVALMVITIIVLDEMQDDN